MDPISAQSVLATAGAAAGDKTYVDDVFSTFLYTGTGSSQSLNNGLDLSGEGGLVWLKKRSSTGNHWVFDTERGANSRLLTNSSGAANTGVSGLSFNSNGFTINTDSSINASGADHVMWSFRKAPGFFDVVTYAGTGSAHSISHSLGSVPGMIIYKAIDDSREWMVYHRSLGASQAVALNLTNAAFSTSDFGSGPTSTHFSVGSSAVNNTSGKNYIAYIFAHDDQSFGTNSNEAIIKCGQFEATVGTEVNLGFEPQWVLIKRIDGNRDWFLIDNMRGMSATSNVNSNYLSPNDNDAETSNRNIFSTSTGFTVADSTAFNYDTHIYMAIRRPHKPPTAATEVFKPVKTTTQPFSVGFPTDLAIHKPTGTGSPYWVPRLTNGYLASNATNQESAGTTYFKFDLQNSYSISNFWGSNETINWQFRRAPGFFDVVTYEGTKQNRTINHNLGATPELMIVKGRDYSDSWQVYNKVSGATKFNTLQQYGDQTGSSRWNDTEPTSAVFTVGTDNGVNNSGYNYVAYLFASLNGISKVGSYTGTGSAINVDCGFAAGARFVLIKRIDGGINISADWYVWDTARGIVSGNDPYILLNSAAAEVTNTDYIDPLNAGFTVTSSAPAALNTSGGTYLFLAIA
mgnify:FL=1